MSYNVTFNSYTLQDTNFRTRIIQHTHLPNKVVQTEPISRADGLTIVNVKYSSREIIVEGRLTSTDRATLVSKIDEMKKKLSCYSGTLDIDYGNDTRRYYATVTKLDIPEDFYNISNVPYSVTFLCADPFGYTTASGIAALTSQTALLKDITMTISGTINSEPVAHVTLTTVSGMTTLQFSNENTGESIIVSRPGGYFQNGDALIINAKKKQVQINNSGIDYVGRFPSVAPDTTQLRVQIQAISANYNITVRYSPKFL